LDLLLSLFQASGLEAYGPEAGKAKNPENPVDPACPVAPADGTGV